MSAATEQQQNNGDVAVAGKEKFNAVTDTVKDDLKTKPAVVVEDNKTKAATDAAPAPVPASAPAVADNGVTSKDKNTNQVEDDEDDDDDAADGAAEGAAVNTPFPSKTATIKSRKRPAEVSEMAVYYNLFIRFRGWA